MIVEYIRYSIDDEHQSQFISAYKEGAIPLLRSEYCLGYDMSQCVEDRTQFMIRIHWTSAEDHLGKFRSSAEFREFLAHIKGYIGNIDEMRHYEIIDSAETESHSRT